MLQCWLKSIEGLVFISPLVFLLQWAKFGLRPVKGEKEAMYARVERVHTLQIELRFKS